MTVPQAALQIFQGSLFTITIPAPTGATSGWGVRMQLRSAPVDENGVLSVTLTTGGGGIVWNGSGWTATITPTQSNAMTLLSGVWDAYGDPDGVPDNATVILEFGTWGMRPVVTAQSVVPQPPTLAPLVGNTIVWNGTQWTPGAVASTYAIDFVIDCGADPTGVSDCAGAWDRAFALLSALGTNTHLVSRSAVLIIPPGAYTLKSNPVVSTWNFQNLATTLYIEGSGQDTTLFQFSGFDLPQFANMFSLFVRDITFAGTTSSYLIPDMTNGIGTNCSNSIVFERVKFYNIAATQSILTLLASQTIIMRDCQIAACGATTNAKAMIVVNAPQICLFENFVTLDIGLVNGFAAVGKDNANFKEFLVLGGATQLDGLVTFSHCFWDESTTASVTIQGDASNPMPRVVFDQCYWNPSTASGPMIDASNVELLEVNGCIDSNFHAGTTSLIVNAVSVNHVRARKVRIVTSEPGSSNTIAADAACKLVEVEDSPGLVINAASLTATRTVVRANGVQSSLFSTGAAVTANQLVKLTSSGVQTLAAGDATSLLFGVTQDSAGGSGINVHVALRGQRVTVLSDGATTIAVGDQITNSAATAGDVKKGVTNVIGVALTSATNIAGTAFDIQLL